jgi:hypothetical protein
MLRAREQSFGQFGDRRRLISRRIKWRFEFEHAQAN